MMRLIESNKFSMAEKFNHSLLNKFSEKLASQNAVFSNNQRFDINVKYIAVPREIIFQTNSTMFRMRQEKKWVESISCCLLVNFFPIHFDMIK